MSDEPGHAARHPVDLPVYIRYRRRPFRSARGHELSARGMSLAVQALTLPVGTPIELELRALGRAWSLPALVTHGDGNGIGVMFRDPQPALCAALFDAVASGPTNPSFGLEAPGTARLRNPVPRN